MIVAMRIFYLVKLVREVVLTGVWFFVSSRKSVLRQCGGGQVSYSESAEQNLRRRAAGVVG